ncbi:MAG: helix-turn-helix transcriptional regulator [bacterium]|nr:helix-turn-helix transcriptional regulator [bacterium]
MKKMMKKTIVITFISLSVMTIFLFSNTWDFLAEGRQIPVKVKKNKPAVQGSETGAAAGEPLYVYCVLEDSSENKSTPATGEYFLKVKDADQKKQLNQTDSVIRLVVVPPFWTTWWFRIFSLFSIGGFFLLLYQAKEKYFTLKGNRERKMKLFFTKYNISKREQEIALLVLQGETNKSIEEKLFISAHTVKNHIYNIYRKLGIKNRLQLTNLFREFK